MHTTEPSSEACVSVREQVEGTLNGLSGQLFGAAELSKRGFQVLMTLGSAKEIDLIAHNFETKQKFAVHVKTLRGEAYFPGGEIEDGELCVLVLLSAHNESVQHVI